MRVLFACLFCVVLSACGGGGGGGASNAIQNTIATTSVSVAPFKGQFTAGTVVIKDATGNVVPLSSGGSINPSTGTANVVYSSNVRYPLTIEVTGNYLNELTGLVESSNVPLRSIIASNNSALVNPVIPVSIATEMVVADIERRFGTISASAPLTNQAAISSLSAVSVALGIPALTIPVFDPNTHKTSDRGTIVLAALAVAANSQNGANLIDKVKALANAIVNLDGAAPSSLISQSTVNSALTTVTTGPQNIWIGQALPAPPPISATNYSSIYTSIIPTNKPLVFDGVDMKWDQSDWQ